MTSAQPHISTIASVQPDWIDFNGHLNMAFYSVFMDNAAGEMFQGLGFGAGYRERTGFTTFAAESHVTYKRELHLDAKVFVETQLLDFDRKRIHFFQTLKHVDGWVSATAEGMGLHIDTNGPKVAPVPDDIFANLEALMEQHGQLPLPSGMGHRIGIPGGRFG